jgi:flagellin
MSCNLPCRFNSQTIIRKVNKNRVIPENVTDMSWEGRYIGHPIKRRTRTRAGSLRSIPEEQDVFDMAISLQTNVASLMAQQNLQINNDFQNKTIGRLTSGYRINSSGDDAAGLAVANQYRSNVAELTQGVRNANDGISTLQTIDGGMSNISKILDRLKTLATESDSDTFTGNRATLDQEYQDLLGEIDRQAGNIGLDSVTHTYVKSLAIYIGGSSPTVNVDLTGSTVDTSAGGLNLAGTDANAGAAAAITAINAAITKLGTAQGAVGSGQNKLSFAVSLAQTEMSATSAAESRIRDADVASEAANMTKAQVLQQATVAAMAQANSAPQAILALLRG